MPQINLLPWREGLRKERQKQFMVAAAAGAVLGLGLTLIMSWTMSRFIDHQIARNGYLHEQIAIVDQQIEEISDLEAKKERLLARMEIIEQLQRSRPEVVHLVDELVRTVPEGVYLSSLSQSGMRLELDGVAQSNTRVSTYMRNIDSSEWMTAPDLNVIKTKQEGRFRNSDFKLFANQVTRTGRDDAEHIGAETEGAVQ